VRRPAAFVPHSLARRHANALALPLLQERQQGGGCAGPGQAWGPQVGASREGTGGRGFLATHTHSQAPHRARPRAGARPTCRPCFPTVPLLSNSNPPARVVMYYTANMGDVWVFVQPWRPEWLRDKAWPGEARARAPRRAAGGRWQGRPQRGNARGAGPDLSRRCGVGRSASSARARARCLFPCANGSEASKPSQPLPCLPPTTCERLQTSWTRSKCACRRLCPWEPPSGRWRRP
jgi:hypothetical protein